MDARGTCDGRHRASKRCPDPECYLREELSEATPTPTELPPITDADNLASELPWRPEDHGGLGEPSEDTTDPRHDRENLDALPVTPDRDVCRYPNCAIERGERVDKRTRGPARAIMERLASEPIEFGPGIYRWTCTREGGYQRTIVAHELPPAPEGWRWSSAQCTAVGGRGALQVNAAVVDAGEGARSGTGPQALQLEITGRTGYCTSLDVLLFARPT